MTGAAAKLAARAEDLPEGSARRALLEGARRFKAAWVEFGRLLSGVKREGLWREWGYATFEAYCAKELFIKPATAEKLTMSFGFLERHEPELARSRGEPKAPSFEVIEVLSRAEAAGRLSQAGWREMRDDVLERPATPASISRRIAEKFGPPPSPPAPGRAERLERIGALAQRLAAACEGEPAIPRAAARRAADLSRELDALARRS